MTEPLSDKRIQGIEDRLSKATQGPWEFDSARGTHDSPVYAVGSKEEYGYIGPARGGVVGSSEWIWLSDSDGLFIANSWQDIHDLLLEVRRLRYEMAQFQVEPAPKN